MPGHIFNANCACGFSRELEPGADEFEGFKSRVMAYSADTSDIETVDEEAAERAALKIIEDPCLSDADASLEKFLEESMKPFDHPYGPYLCPRCRENSLYLRGGGFWD
jgi:hypothetical protein